jgi:hypothetical protein
MRLQVAILALVLGLAAGCEYNVPVTTHHTIPVDPAVLGLWQAVPEEGKTVDVDERLLVLKYSDTEYLIRYPSGKNGMYFRGYPVKIGDLVCVQIQLIGSSDEPVQEEDRKYHVVSYAATLDTLEVKTLNTEVVPKTAATGDELLKSIQKNLGNQNLFHDPGRFRKVGSEK